MNGIKVNLYFLIATYDIVLRGVIKFWVTWTHLGMWLSCRLFSIRCYFVLLLGSAAVFAGKPGRYYRQDMSLALNTGLIEEWSKCIKTLSVSSRESFAHRLVDGSDSCWQSCGSQGKVSGVTYNSCPIDAVLINLSLQINQSIVPSFCCRTQGIHKIPPPHSILGDALNLCPGLFYSFSLFKHRSSPRVLRPPSTPFSLGVPL